MRKALYTITVLMTVLIIAGCGSRLWQDTKETAGDAYDYAFDTSPTAVSFHDQQSIPIIDLNHEAADVLYKNIGKYELSKRAHVYVSTFTNQNDPTDKAIFGTVVTQQVADRLVQRGVVITEGDPKPAEYLMPSNVDPQKYQNPPQGNINLLPPRAAMLGGTYVIGDNYIYMRARLTRLDDKAIISGANWTIPISDNVRQLLPQLREENGMEPTVKTTFDEPSQ